MARRDPIRINGKTIAEIAEETGVAWQTAYHREVASKKPKAKRKKKPHLKRDVIKTLLGV